MELATEMVSRPDATTNKGPSLQINWLGISLNSLFPMEFNLTRREQSQDNVLVKPFASHGGKVVSISFQHVG